MNVKRCELPGIRILANGIMLRHLILCSPENEQEYEHKIPFQGFDVCVRFGSLNQAKAKYVIKIANVFPTPSFDREKKNYNNKPLIKQHQQCSIELIFDLVTSNRVAPVKRCANET